MNAVQEWCGALLALPEEVWVEYARRREPLRGRVTPAEYRVFWDKATAEAQALAKQYPMAPRALAKTLGVQVHEKPLPDGGFGRATYACFTEPDDIELYTDNVQLLAGLTQAAGADALLEHADVADILLAHELYHALQLKNPDLYALQPHIRLWKVLGIENRSRLVSLEEVSAMAFARQMTGLGYTPYVYDVLLMLPHWPEQARELYRSLLELQAELAKKQEDAV